jgi:sulfate transport system permease protein
LPGFGLTLGITVSYLGAMVILPLAAFTTFLASGTGWSTLWEPRVWSAIRLSLGSALAAAMVDAVLGFVVAWVLVRYTFPGRGFLDALVDLPFALPTAVSGIALTTLFAPGSWLGAITEQWGFSLAYTRWGILIAMVYIGLPFVVRTLQPAIADLPSDWEEAAASLGAGPIVTFWRVTFPSLRPALLTGMSLAFARAVGEYGSIIFIAGNLPHRTEIAPLLIVIKLEQYDYHGAAVIAAIMLLASLGILVTINALHNWQLRWQEGSVA